MPLFSIVQHRTAQNALASLNLAYSTNVTAGNLLVCFTAITVASSPAVSDNLNGAWAEITQVNSASFTGSIWGIITASSGACTVSLTTSPSATSCLLMINEVSNISAFPDGAQNTNATGGANPATSFDNLVSPDFVFGAMVLENSAGSVGAGFTQIDNIGNEFITEWATIGTVGTVNVIFNNGTPGTGSWQVHGVAAVAANPGLGGAPPNLLTLGAGR